MNKEWMMGLGLAGLGLATGGLGLIPGMLGAGAGGLGGLGGALGLGEAAGAAGGADAALAGLGYAGPEAMAAPGLLSQIGSAAGTASKYAPMAGLALNAADKGGLLGGHQTPTQPGQLPQFQQVGGTDGGLAALQQKRMQRQQGLLNMGGGNGFA
jgi:hypothetical protein